MITKQRVLVLNERNIPSLMSETGKSREYFSDLMDRSVDQDTVYIYTFEVQVVGKT